MKIQIGNIYIFSPFQFYNNPEIDRKPMIGIFLERIPDPSPSRWRPAQFKVLGPHGIKLLCCNRWALDPIPEFI